MARARPMTDELREIMYDIACLEPEELSELREALRAWRKAEDDEARRGRIEVRVQQLVGAQSPDRVIVAFEALTEMRV